MHYDGFNAPTWTGGKNWTYVFTGYPLFWPALRNTLWLVVVMVTLRVVFGLGIGLLITKIKTGAGLFRTVFYLPYLAPPVAATMAFVFLLNPGTGPVNHILGNVGIPTPGWFTDPQWSKPALTVLSLWGIGDLMVIFMARAAGRAHGAVRGRRTGRRRRLAPVPVRDAAQHLADRDVRGGHRGHPDHAVLHAAAGGREGRLGHHRQLRPAGGARLSRQVDPDAAATGLRTRLPSASTTARRASSRWCCSPCRWRSPRFCCAAATASCRQRTDPPWTQATVTQGTHGTPARAAGTGPDTCARRTARRRRTLEWIAVHALGLAARRLLHPAVLLVLLTAVMSDNQALTRDLWPHTWQWSNFRTVWDNPGLPHLVAQHPGLRGRRHGADRRVVAAGGVRAGQVPLPAAATWSWCWSSPR